MQLVAQVAFGKEIGAKRIDIHQPEYPGAQRLVRGSPHFSSRGFLLSRSDGGGSVIQLPLVIGALYQAARHGNQREFWYWDRAVLSNQLDAAQRISTQFLRTGWKGVDREYVG